MQTDALNERAIEALLLEHLANAGYAIAKVFGIKHGLCANQFAPPMLGNCVFSIPLAFGGATLVALKQDGNNERKRELLKNPLQDKYKNNRYNRAKI